METIIRNVRDIENSDRQALEQVLGRPLQVNQQVIVQVVTLTKDFAEKPQTAASSAPLPNWCNVYDGLTDEEVAAVEQTILERADLSRASR